MVPVPKKRTAMVMGHKTKIKNQIHNILHGDDRSSVVKKNALMSIIFKACSVLISLLLVPISMHFVGKEQYGIWLTVSSIIAWLALFDIGLSNGLRNKLVKSLAEKDMKTAKIYISTVYVALSLIFTSIWIIFLFVLPFVDWTSLLNIPAYSLASIKELVFIVFTYFCLSIIFKIANSILLADQKAAYSSVLDLLSQAGSLIVIFVMSRFLAGSLFYLSIGMCLVPIVVAILYNYFLFSRKYKEIRPSFKFYRKECVKDLIGLSFQFFIIQIAAIVQYQTANFIIARMFDMSEVTNYNIVYKYFSVLTILFMMLLTPLWSAVTDAYNKKDLGWIRRMVKKYFILFVILSVGGIFMLFLSNFVYTIWIGKEYISIPFILSLWGLVYFIISMYGSIFVNILNGIGAVRIQFLLSFITPVLYVILCYVFIKYLNMGIYAVFIAAIVSNINGFLLAPIQYIKIFKQHKRGIWAA